MKRFQECNLLEKGWRLRWYLAAPFIYLWRKWYSKPIETENGVEHVSGNIIWKLVIAEMDMKMEWWHTQEEVENYLKELKYKK